MERELKTVYWHFGGIMEHPDFTWEVLCKGYGDSPVECVQDAIRRGNLEDCDYLNVENRTYWGCELSFGTFE